MRVFKRQGRIGVDQSKQRRITPGHLLFIAVVTTDELKLVNGDLGHSRDSQAQKKADQSDHCHLPPVNILIYEIVAPILFGMKITLVPVADASHMLFCHHLRQPHLY